MTTRKSVTTWTNKQILPTDKHQKRFSLESEGFLLAQAKEISQKKGRRDGKSLHPARRRTQSGAQKIARMLSHTGNPRRCRGDPIITCTTRQVGRLPRATSLPTSGPWYREACNPRGDAASLIKNVGLKGSRQMPFRAQGRNKNRFGRRGELIPPPARQSPRHRRAGP